MSARSGVGARREEPWPEPPPEQRDEFASRLRWWLLGIVVVKAVLISPLLP